MANPRIIAGTAKGMRLKTLPGKVTRPITDRVKEALFNIIGYEIVGSKFLDLFGGSGSVGIEALSRGADHVDFIEINTKAFGIIKENLAKSRLESQATVIKGNAFQAPDMPKLGIYDYIFIAPPQYHTMWIKALQMVDQNPKLLAESGWVIVQIDPVEDEEIALENLQQFDSRKYGSTLLKFYASRFPTH